MYIDYFCTFASLNPEVGRQPLEGSRRVKAITSRAGTDIDSLVGGFRSTHGEAYRIHCLDEEDVGLQRHAR